MAELNDIYTKGRSLSSSGESKPFDLMNFGAGSSYVPIGQNGKTTKEYSWLPGLASGSAENSTSYDFLKELKNPWDDRESWWENTLKGRGNVIGMAGLGLSAYNAFSNAFDFTGERAKRDQFLNTQIDLGKQMVANNIKQDNIQTANANARNEAAKKFTPYTPTTTMLS
jgi:hypothetical protein